MLRMFHLLRCMALRRLHKGSIGNYDARGIFYVGLYSFTQDASSPDTYHALTMRS